MTMNATPRPGPATPTAEDHTRMSRRMVLLASILVAAGVLNHARSLRFGFMYDDYVHQFMIRTAEQERSINLLHLFDFRNRPEKGDPLHGWAMNPWWTSPDFRIRFFRPVTSASIVLDHYLWNNWLPGYHITSLALFAVFLVLAMTLYRTLGAPPAAALWALAFLAMEDGNTIVVSWIANRNALLAGIFVIGCVLAFIQYLQKNRLWRLAVAIVCFLLGCMSKESGIIAVPLIALAVFLIDPGLTGVSWRERVKRVLRCRALWFFGVVAVAYAAFYAQAGYGTNSLLYCSPTQNPEQYLWRFACLIPLSGLSLFFGFSSDIVASVPHWLLPALVTGLLSGIIVLTIILRSTRPTPLVLFALFWIPVSLIPAAGADLSDRLYMNASIGSALLTGLFFASLQSPRALLRQHHFGRLALAATLGFIGLIASVPSTAFRGNVFWRLNNVDLGFVKNAEIDRSQPPPRPVLLLNSPSPMLALEIMPMWAITNNDFDTRFFAMQFGRRAMTWRRESDRDMTLHCQPPEAPFGAGRFERLFRTSALVVPHEVLYETALFKAIPLAVDRDGVRSVLLRFDQSLDDASCQFLAWQNGGFSPVQPPAIGQTMEIPKVPISSPYALDPSAPPRPLKNLRDYGAIE